MKYSVTSVEASKMLKKLMEEKRILVENEGMSAWFNAALGEDVESVRPEYDYAKVQDALENIDTKIRILKHAINLFNASQVVPISEMTIDQVLVYIPQLTEMKNKLYEMQSSLPKQRTAAIGIGRNAVIDYRYANYDVARAKDDYAKVSDELRKVQTALDIVNTTVKMEVELPD